MKNKEFVSLFSGCGGLDLGFIMAGYKCIAAFDKEKKVIQVHNKNISCEATDVDLSLQEYDSLIPKSDILIAGPPCQGFSTAGKMKEDDDRNSLLQVVVRVAQKTKPSIIVVENVPGLQSSRMLHHYTKLVDNLEMLDYQTKTVICNAHDFGVPQRRRRLFIIAWNKKLQLSHNVDLSELKKRVSVNEALSDMNEGIMNHSPKILSPDSSSYLIASHIKAGQKLCDVRGGKNSVHTWDIPEVFGEINDEERIILELVQSLRRKERRRDFGDSDPVSITRIKEEVAFASDAHIVSLIKKGYLCHKGSGIDLAHSFNGWYRRLDDKEFSPTVDTRFGRPKYFLHPTENRGLTIREAARLQTFPDNFMFEGTEADQYKMIGNAVPPVLAKVIATYIEYNLLKN